MTLTDEQHAFLFAEAHRTGLSAAELVRRALDATLPGRRAATRSGLRHQPRRLATARRGGRRDGAQAHGRTPTDGRYARRREPLRGHRHRRRRARRRPPHRARRGADAGVHARRHEGDGQEPRPGRAARGRRADHPRQHVPPALPARRRRDRRARRAARVLGLGRADPDRLGRLPGLLAPGHAGRRSTTTASRSGRSTTARPRASRPSSRLGIQRNLGSDIAMCFDICPPAGVPRARARGGRTPHDPLGRPAARGRARPRPAALRDRPGRRRPRAPAPLDRGDRRARLRRLRARRARGGGEPGGDVRGDRAGRRRCCPRRSPATSWASATPRGSCA